MIFKVRTKGTNNVDWHIDNINAENEAEAIAKADTIFGVTRDENGKQTNPDVIKVELITRQE